MAVLLLVPQYINRRARPLNRYRVVFACRESFVAGCEGVACARVDVVCFCFFLLFCFLLSLGCALPCRISVVSALHGSLVLIWRVDAVVCEVYYVCVFVWMVYVVPNCS